MVDVTRVGGARRWLLPALVTLLILGHTCELSAYAELVSEHAAGPHETSQHDDVDDHALTCDGTVVIPVHSVVKLSPALATATVVRAIVRVLPLAPRQPARVERASTGPPLFLLLSSLLI